jgi:hypothetical protein
MVIDPSINIDEKLPGKPTTNDLFNGTLISHTVTVCRLLFCPLHLFTLSKRLLYMTKPHFFTLVVLQVIAKVTMVVTIDTRIKIESNIIQEDVTISNTDISNGTDINIDVEGRH